MFQSQDQNVIVYNKSSCRMREVDNNSVHLIVCSPPYPMIKMWDEFFFKNGATNYHLMHKYLADVWQECYRVLVDGGIACINIGDVVRKIEGTFRIFPNHSKIIEIFDSIGFVMLPYILWKKPTTKPNSFLGSGFCPPNAYVTLDCEYVLIFRKGNLRRPSKELRDKSRYTKEERDKWFSQLWSIAGRKQFNQELGKKTASFPEEVPRRLIRMFSLEGEIVLDPFLGTGTTIKVAQELNRKAIGYEVQSELIPIIKGRIKNE